MKKKKDKTVKHVHSTDETNQKNSSIAGFNELSTDFFG
jgi:hypothetical protein